MLLYTIAAFHMPFIFYYRFDSNETIISDEYTGHDILIHLSEILKPQINFLRANVELN